MRSLSLRPADGLVGFKSDKMTFEEWFEEEFKPSFAYSNDDPMIYESAARRAWDAAFDAGYELAEENCGYHPEA